MVCRNGLPCGRCLERRILRHKRTFAHPPGKTDDGRTRKSDRGQVHANTVAVLYFRGRPIRASRIEMSTDRSRTGIRRSRRASNATHLRAHSGLVDKPFRRVVDAAATAACRAVYVYQLLVRLAPDPHRWRHRIVDFSRVISKLQAWVEHGIESPQHVQKIRLAA